MLPTIRGYVNPFRIDQYPSVAMEFMKDPALALDYAREMDATDPLMGFQDQFLVEDPHLIYLDGNSLGRVPKRTVALMQQLVEVQWATRLVRGWGEHWIDLPQRLGGKIAGLIGAKPSEVLVCDSTSINLYKLIMAALAARSDRRQIVSDRSNFPSDVYLLQGCAKDGVHEVILADDNLIEDSLSDDVALLTLSHTAFKSGLIHPMEQLTAKAHSVGALTLWDLSHSVGAIPIDLSQSKVDLAVGCTYKYLNGGPGAPAFLFVREDLQSQLLSPIWGWFGQKDPFGFSLEYSPAEGLTRFLAGTPPILSMAAIEPGIDLVCEAGIARIREKSVLQTEFLIGLWEVFLEPLGMTLNSPRDSKIRGSHVSFGHPHGFQIDQALINEMKVIPDFRHPDNIRIGVTPLSTTFVELATAVARIKQVIEEKAYEKYPSAQSKVT